MKWTTEDIKQELLTSEDLAQQGSWRSLQKSRSTGELISIRRGIYLPTEIWNNLPPWDQHTARILAVAKKMPDVVLSHTSAAQLFGLVTPQESQVHIYSEKNSRSRLQGVTKHCLLEPSTPTIKFTLGIRATSPLLTTLDSVRFLPIKQGVALADSALNQQLVDHEELTQHLKNSGGKNCRKMRLVATMMSANSESAGESYTRLLLDEMGLVYTEQKQLFIEGYMYRCDFALEQHGIIIEFDGRLKLTDFGASDAVLERERYREKALQNSGWVVFRVDWDLVVRRPADFKRQLNQLIPDIPLLPRNIHKK